MADNNSFSASNDRRRRRHAGRILMVTGCRADSTAYDDALLQAGFSTLYVNDTSEAYRMASQVVLSAIVLERDCDDEQCNVELTGYVRAHPRLVRLPIVVIGEVSRRTGTQRGIVGVPRACSADALAEVVAALVNAACALGGDTLGSRDLIPCCISASTECRSAAPHESAAG
jgi:hypothetical protein